MNKAVSHLILTCVHPSVNGKTDSVSKEFPCLSVSTKKDSKAKAAIVSHLQRLSPSELNGIGTANKALDLNIHFLPVSELHSNSIIALEPWNSQRSQQSLDESLFIAAKNSVGLSPHDHCRFSRSRFASAFEDFCTVDGKRAVNWSM